MNVHCLIPLLAFIAYIPLFIILIANRPWRRQKQIFALYLVAAMAWSFGDVLFRSDYLMNEKMILAKVIQCSFWLGLSALYYFLRTYYETREPRFPWVYVFTGIVFVLAILFLPQSVKLEGGVVPVYGLWIYPLGLYGYGLIGLIIYGLAKKLRAVTDPEVRNQLVYLLLVILIQATFNAFTFTKIGQEFPLAHIGNFLSAMILTYAVIKHRLLDMRLILRRGLTLFSMAVIGIAIYLLLFAIGHFLFNVEIVSTNLILGIGIALVIAFIIYQIRDFAASQIDRLFYRDSYEYRIELNTFVQQKIKGIIGLDELGNELLTLLSGAIRCKQAFLLLPQEDTGDFYIRFTVPSGGERPFFVIKSDNPIINWLKKENTYLTKEKLEIVVEFKGLWLEEKEDIRRLNIQLFFPLMSRGNIIGLLALGEKQNKTSYKLEDINLSEKIISRVATSLEKEFLQDQLKKREQELELINRLAGVISSSLNIQEVYDAFVNELKEVVETDSTAIVSIQENEIYFAALSTEVGSDWHTGQKIPIGGTATEWVHLNKKLFYDMDLAYSNRFSMGAEYFKRGIRSILYLPLLIKGEVTGVLILGSRKPYAYSPEQLVLLEHLASQIAAPIENSRLYARSEQIARVDILTELFNRRHFDERIKEEIDRHSRYGDILTLLLLDLDHFKKYNDTYGHMSGDRIIVHASNLIKNTIRSSDLAFRYGGDEFAVILPNSPTSEAFSVAERIREKISSEMSSRQWDITVSIGLASWPGDGQTLDELCNAADIALYYAKRTGQNRTSIASKTLFSLSESSVNVNNETEVLSTIYALAATIEARDKFTYGHSRKVSRYAVAVAEALNLPPEQVAIISTAALLHDIGKIGIPDNVLNKSSKLLDEEWELLKAHPKLSATILGHVPSLSACLAAVRHHHERWDGAGYPSGLKGEAIPIEARILCVTDAFEAMISDRPYRGPLKFKQAIAELERCSGSQFDPKVVSTFIPIVLSTAPDDAELETQRVHRKAD